MNASPKVNLVNEKALLEELYSFLVIFLLLIDHSKIVVSINVCHWLLESLLKTVDSGFYLSPLIKDAAHAYKGI